MPDIYLDPSSGDISITDGLLRLTETVDEDTRQRLSITLGTYRGEWFLDISLGLPYFQMVLKGNGKEFADSLIKQAIRQDEGIVTLIDYSSEIIGGSYFATFRASTTDDEIITIVNQQLT